MCVCEWAKLLAANFDGRAHDVGKVVQRLYSGFPSGPQGVGLLLLRLALALHLITEGSVRVVGVFHSTADGTGAAAAAFGVGLVIAGVLAAAGFLTAVVQATIAAMILGNLGIQLWRADLAFMPGSLPVSGCEAAVAISLALLGPGAYSADAHLFGRQQITIHSPADT